MSEHQRQLGRGFNWLGGATILAKIIDFSTVVVMLLYLSKQQVGIASLVVSFGMVVEAFNGLGTSEALIQARSVSRTQLDTLFWYIMGAALVVSCLTLLVAPGIGALYGMPGLGLYLVAIAAKQPLVGAAVIPLAIMNRNLHYRRVAIVGVCATFAGALTRIALGAAGTGVWALVGGFAASGLYTLIGATCAQPFRPRLRFRLATILRFTRFGARASAANVGEQMFKNVDYMLIGWFWGPAPLAVYRVAFDIAMEPAMAVGTLVNRTALPVLARVSAVQLHLAQTLRWSLHRLSILVAPVMVGLVLGAGPLTALLHDHQGNSYAAAAMPLRLLAVAALLRVTMMLLSTVMMGAGRPGLSARLSGVTLVLLSVGITGAGLIFNARAGIIAAAAVWVGIYPLLLGWGVRYLRQSWQISFVEVLDAYRSSIVGIGIMVPCVLLCEMLAGSGDPRVNLGIVVVGTALLYAGLFRYERRKSVATA